MLGNSRQFLASNKTRNAIPALVTALLWSVWTYTLPGDISRSFLKLPEVNMLYSRVFFPLLFFSLMLLRRWIEQTSWPKVILYSTLVGYLIAFLALLAAVALTKDGSERLANSFQTVDPGEFLATQLLMSGILAGWFYGALGALGLKCFQTLTEDLK